MELLLETTSKTHKLEVFLMWNFLKPSRQLDQPDVVYCWWPTHPQPSSPLRSKRSDGQMQRSVLLIIGSMARDLDILLTPV